MVPPEALSERCARLQQEWATAEHQRMSAEYQSGVNQDTGSLGPLYYAQVQVEGVPVEAMIGSGSSATVTSFALFK